MRRLLDWLHRRRDRHDPIDSLIAENRARVKFDGFDPALRAQKRGRRGIGNVPRTTASVRSAYCGHAVT